MPGAPAPGAGSGSTNVVESGYFEENVEIVMAEEQANPFETTTVAQAAKQFAWGGMPTITPQEGAGAMRVEVFSS